MNDRQVNEILARKLMGWSWVWYNEQEHHEGGCWVDKENKKAREGYDWSPITNISHSLGNGNQGTVVGEMEKRGFNLDLLSMFNSKTWAARFIPFDTDRTQPWKTTSWGESPCRAISLAALEIIR